MSTVSDIIQAALELDRSDRATVALSMLDSLPDDAMEPDEILAEALRRDAEIESGQVKELSYEEFLAGIQRPGRAA
ncbi:hypothetical protein GCM10023213_12590 [Prosthecobacter algae]|uniref:Addiction module component n=1 Tax=Prosthecobacter algae TaxID=1144682 RepID=A0ABP9NZD4_9BACT